MEHEIIWRPEARADLFAIYDWVADHADPAIAFGYTGRIEAFVARLNHFPHRGTPRFDIAQGLRTVTFERRIIIAYRADMEIVHIVRLIDAAQNFEEAFASE